MKKFLFFLLVAHSSQLVAYSQSIGIGTNNPNNSSILDVQSTSKGVLLPRMTSAQRKAILNPETGLLVYDIDKKSVMMFEGTKWGQLYFKNSDITEPAPKTIANGESYDNFGNAVSINGDYAVAGAFHDDVSGKSNQGSAYVFHRINGSWVQEAQLFAADGAANDLFGFSVSISGNYIVVGAPEDQVGSNIEQGSVYVFVRNGINWTQQHKFVAPDGAAEDHFGFSVSMSANQFIVGCPDDDYPAYPDMGSVTFYLLTGNTWAQEIKLNGTGPAPNDHFGWSVAINFNSAIVGAPGDTNPPDLLGSAQIFSKIVGWSAGQKLVPSQQSEAGFGYSVAIDLTTVAVSQIVSGGGFGSIYAQGRVYVYVPGAFGIWFEQTYIDEPNFTFAHFFGKSLSISGDNLVVGSAKDLLQSQGSDSAHVVFYKRTGTVWEEQLISFNGSPSLNGGFGYAVSINGFNVIIGAPKKKTQKGEVNFMNIE